MNNFIDQIIRVAIYLRLSKEDGDLSFSENGKNESNSINNQRELIRLYLEKHPEMQITAEYKDDGKTGTNFDRPGFIKMMEDVKKGLIDCIIVKDLSRFGRDYIKCGEYIQVIFPQLKIRFIAISEGYDSAVSKSTDAFLFPITNIMNDNYARDISKKVRSSMDGKRETGAFMGCYVPYGYERDPEDKNHLVIDPYAGEVVRDIFRWSIDGYSPHAIAEKLNSLGILSPMEYKCSLGSNFQTPFKKQKTTLWTHVAVRRILKNDIYIGMMVQGKRMTPNYKTKQILLRDESEWYRVENTHNAIIEKNEYDLVQRILQEDIRGTKEDGLIHPLCGRVYCADCGSPMVRKPVTSKGKRYVYYICSGNKSDKTKCTRHRISEQSLMDAVLAAIQSEITLILDLQKALAKLDELAWERAEVEKIDANIVVQREIIEKNNLLRNGVYEDLVNRIVTKEEYVSLRNEFTMRITRANQALEELESQRANVLLGLCNQQGFLSKFNEYENLTELTRRTVVCLVDRILIHEDLEIDIRYNHRNEIASIIEFLKRAESQKKGKIVVLPRLEVV